MRVVFGDCHFDSETHELRRASEPVRLSRKAFHLLEVLIAKRPAAVPQQELYDAIWPDSFVDMANLHNLVSQLRSALDDDRHEMIRTVYGVGFSFAAPATEVSRTPPVDAVSAWSLAVGEDAFFLPFGEALVGRSGDATVHIPRATMSRHHARLHVTADAVFLEDLGSKNGTYVNGQRIVDRLAVGPGDEIRFGKVHAHLMKDEATASESEILAVLEPATR
jgi:DNA-binding winged helix-turn-helix (wHTH) protein